MNNRQSARDVTRPATRHKAIVPSDTSHLSETPRAIYCKTAGNIVIRDAVGHDETYAMTVGQILPFQGVRVLATGTTGAYIAWY